MNKKTFPLLSIVAHVLLIAIAIVHFDFSATTPLHPGEKFIESYVTPQIQKSIPPPEKIVTLKTKAQINLVKKKIISAPQKIMTPPKPQGDGEAVSALQALLHAAIQKQQQYPASALEMEREGSIRVRFTLYENGTITNLRIVKSSGTTSLDEAALAAVNNATPFQKVQKYLHKPQEYQLDVVFELT